MVANGKNMISCEQGDSKEGPWKVHFQEMTSKDYFQKRFWKGQWQLVIYVLLYKTVDKVQKKMDEILKQSKKPRHNLKPAEELDLQALWSTANLKNLLAHKGSFTVIFNTKDYIWKVSDLLGGQMYNRLAKDPPQRGWNRELVISSRSSPYQRMSWTSMTYG